ncbi:MAG: hypothetical protein NTZ84_02070 [Candidatus Nealsonbacteria bacterium]|nr:hypothetical protein [Candidatus Nealsonbacteria bacterium]
MNEEQKKDLKTNQTDSKGEKFLRSDYLKWAIMGLIITVIIFLIFGAGIWVGEKRAGFSFRWAEQYHRNFAGPQEGFLGDWKGFPQGEFIEAYGAFGQIIKINASTSPDQTLVVKGKDDVEKIVLIKEDTIIKNLRETVKMNNLKVDDYIIVIGEPNEAGQTEAKFIRIVPPPPKETSLNMPPLRVPRPNL